MRSAIEVNPLWRTQELNETYFRGLQFRLNNPEYPPCTSDGDILYDDGSIYALRYFCPSRVVFDKTLPSTIP